MGGKRRPFHFEHPHCVKEICSEQRYKESIYITEKLTTVNTEFIQFLLFL